jgi:outer membrane biosynthesis protein TonB
MRYKWFILSLLLLLVFVVRTYAGESHGDKKEQKGTERHEKEYKPTPTSCVAPSPTPTSQPDPTPTVEITPEPTKAPELPQEEPKQAGGSASTNTTGAPSCTSEQPNTIGFVWPDLSRFYSEGTLIVRWVPALHANTVNIRYGNDGINWPYSAVNLGNGGTAEIKGLDTHKHWYAQVIPFNGCRAGEWSQVIDP